MLKSNFHKNRKSKDALYTQCKVCRREYYNNKTIKLFQKQKECYLENRDSELERCKEYKILNREKTNGYVKNKMKTDLNYKLADNIRARTRQAFKSQNVIKTNKTFYLLGCSHSSLRLWIGSQLYSEMTLENYGKIWCLDHCLAVASFNLVDEKEMKKCFNWVNLRPMYMKDNIIKGDKIDMKLYLLQEKKANFL